MKPRRRMRPEVSMTDADSHDELDCNDHDALVSRVERAELATLQRELVLASVSHDLRDPLNTIALVTKLLAEDFPATEFSSQLDRHVGALARATARMQRLVNDLLDVGALEAGHVRIDASAVLLENVLCDAMHALSPSANAKGVQLDISVEEKLRLRSQHIWCDPDRILQIFTNLGANAIKFTPPGGRVRITAARDHDTDGTAVIRFGVEDTGAGIAPHELSRVFDRYWQSQATAHLGAGLGLTIVKELVKAHRGSVWVHSDFGRGSTFTFTIPLTREMHHL